MKSRLADPSLLRELEAAVRRRVRGDEAQDVVQATLADVLAAPHVPEEPEEFRRFVFGVARNKVFDHFRRHKRQVEGFDDDAVPGSEQPLSARDILRWAEGELPDSESQHTLEWMLREGQGEKLEHIARDASLPAPRVRQRVSRLRRFLRERWQAELMLAGLLALLGALAALYWYQKHVDPENIVMPEPRVVPSAPRAIEPSRPAADPAPLAVPEPTPAPPPSASAAPAPSPRASAAPTPPPVSPSDVPAKQAKPRVPTASTDNVKSAPPSQKLNVLEQGGSNLDLEFDDPSGPAPAKK
jgi:DNA-directed RNA polymerase specialized sigma24 family protein